MSPAPLAANRPVYAWTPERSGCYEVWYGKVGGFHPEHAAALWFRITLEDTGDGHPRATCWGTWFEEGLPAPVHLTSGGSVPLLPSPGGPGFMVEIAPGRAFGFEAATGRYVCRGDAAGPGAALAWDLSWAPRGPAFRYLAWEWLRRLLSPSGACTPCPDVRVSGSVQVTLGASTRSFSLDGAPGMQGHIWGTRKAHSWAWCHGNDWVDAASGEPVEAAFEALRVRRSPGAPALTTMYLHLDGRHHFFNRPSQLVAHRACLLGRRVGNRGVQLDRELYLEHHGDLPIRAHFALPARQVAHVEYRDTDGRLLRNRNATLAPGELRVGGRHLRTRLGATLELVERD